MIVNIVIFVGLSSNKKLLIIGSIFLFITGSIASYYFYYFGVIPTKIIVKTCFETYDQEVYELVSMKVIAWVIFSIAVCIFLLLRSPKVRYSIFTIICLSLVAINIVNPQYRAVREYFPMQYLHSTYLYFFERINKVGRQDISNECSFAENIDPDIIAVLIIGESARYDHFGINGYHRDTTPLISKINNLFSFKAQSAANITYLSVQSLLSRHPAKDLELSNKETGLLSILRKLNVNTYWIGTQTIRKYLSNVSSTTMYDEADFVLVPGGSILFGRNDYDGVMLPYIQNIIDKTGKKLLVIHTSGSHWRYSSRYPSEFSKFTPGCKHEQSDPSNCGLEGLVNTYDNSILYTDFFLHKVIDILKDKNAFVIYASDHGESLGEEGRYGHGLTVTPEQTTIPFIVWFSDKFVNKNKNVINAVNSHKGQEISHDYIFHSIFDCMSVNSNAIDKSMSLCSQRQHNFAN